MFRSALRPRRASRALAATTFVIALSVTSLGGNATAAPSADEGRGCSVLAQTRNESVSRLHEAWEGFREQLRDLKEQTGELRHRAKRGQAASLTASVRNALPQARRELDAIRASARQEIRDAVELGRACVR